MHFAVAQRTHEMGVRLALGAQRIDIVREVLVTGGRPVMWGMLAGLWLALSLAAAVRSVFSGTRLHVEASDPLVYGGAACCWRSRRSRRCGVRRGGALRAILWMRCGSKMAREEIA